MHSFLSKTGNAVIDTLIEKIAREFGIVQGRVVAHTFTDAAIGESITHNMKVSPSGWTVEKKNIPCDVWAESADEDAWTTTTITLRCNVAGATVTLRIV